MMRGFGNQFRSRDQGGRVRVADLSATIQDEVVKIVAAASEIDDLSADISAYEAYLNAIAIRYKEATDFAADEKDLIEVIAMLQRAVAIVAGKRLPVALP